MFQGLPKTYSEDEMIVQDYRHMPSVTNLESDFEEQSKQHIIWVSFSQMTESKYKNVVQEWLAKKPSNRCFITPCASCEPKYRSLSEDMDNQHIIFSMIPDECENQMYYLLPAADNTLKQSQLIQELTAIFKPTSLSRLDNISFKAFKNFWDIYNKKEPSTKSNILLEILNDQFETSDNNFESNLAYGAAKEKPITSFKGHSINSDSSHINNPMMFFLSLLLYLALLCVEAPSLTLVIVVPATAWYTTGVLVFFIGCLLHRWLGQENAEGSSWLPYTIMGFSLLAIAYYTFALFPISLPVSMIIAAVVQIINLCISIYYDSSNHDNSWSIIKPLVIPVISTIAVLGLVVRPAWIQLLAQFSIAQPFVWTTVLLSVFAVVLFFCVFNFFCAQFKLYQNKNDFEVVRQRSILRSNNFSNNIQQQQPLEKKESSVEVSHSLSNSHLSESEHSIS